MGEYSFSLSTYPGTRSTPIKNGDSSENAVFGPIACNIGKAVGVLVMVHIIDMVEERWARFQTLKLDGHAAIVEYWGRVVPGHDGVDVMLGVQLVL